MPAEKVRIGFVGVGRMGQCAHLRNYAVIPECQVVAVADVRQETARQVAAAYGIPNVYPDAATMLANEDLDGIVASQQFEHHVRLLPELLKAGKPLFIEKPLAASVAGGQALLEKIESSGTWVMPGYHKRSDPASEFARDHIRTLKQTGELGEPRYVRVTMPAGDWIAGGFEGLIDAGDPYPEPVAEERPADLDAASYAEYVKFVNYYIHQVNYVNFLLDEDYEITYADPAGVLLAGVSESGTAVAIEMSPYETTLDWQESALVGFAKGYVRVDLPPPLARNRAGTVEIMRDAGQGLPPETTRPGMPSTHAMYAQARNFVLAIRGERTPMCDARQALRDLELARDYLELFSST